MSAAATVLAACLAAGLAACTGTPAPPAPSPTASSTPSGPGSGSEWTATSTGAPVPAASPTAGRLHVAPVARLVLPAEMHVAVLALSRSRVAWSGCRPCAGAAWDATDVYVADLPRGRPRSVARTRFRWGSTSVVGLSGDVVVWLDGADVRDGGAPDGRWALRALDLRSGAGWTIAEGNRSAEPSRTPVALVTGRSVVWQLFDPVTAAGPVRSADLRRRTVRTVAPSVPGLLRAVTARGLVYTGSDPEVRRDSDAPVATDAYLLPAAGGRALALTAEHDVNEVVAAGEQVLWSTRSGPGQSLWSASLTGSPPTPIFDGGVVGFTAGSGFAAWATSGTDPVLQVGAGGRPVTLPDVPAAGGLLVADGDRLAVLTVPDRGVSAPVAVVVASVARTP